MPTLAELEVAKLKRTEGTLTIKRPTGSLSGIFVEAYVRAGKEAQPSPVGDVPTDVTDDVTVTVPQTLLRAAKEVFVEVSFVVKQPAKVTGEIKFEASLEVSGESADADATLKLKQGDTGGLVDLTFWVIPPGQS